MNDWIDDLDREISFIDDVDSRTLILLRMEAQYVPALKGARSAEAAWRAWEAFRYYLTARTTSRKPFSLSQDDADRVIAIAIEMLDLPPHVAP